MLGDAMWSPTRLWAALRGHGWHGVTVGAGGGAAAARMRADEIYVKVKGRQDQDAAGAVAGGVFGRRRSGRCGCRGGSRSSAVVGWRQVASGDDSEAADSIFSQSCLCLTNRLDLI
ncbi:hypothetical protein GUJ93_ZPchr0005g15447 [Zizania palustris]|uniref:Uncharacterized protein n=1 Tax=Zizania palustris TaxID=103762 RepID=A0A8J5SGV8_ZIZPA|nr:hypothetical protein GUJ93_ZPchr0005g15447 [Zizania palustris]